MPQQIAQNSSQSDSSSRSLHEQIETLQQQNEQLTEKVNQLVNRLERDAVHPSKTNKSRHFWRNLGQYLAKLNSSSDHQPRFSLNEILFSYVGSFLGIATLAYLSVNSGYPLIAAPFGAAAVLVFAVPNSPLAQPRNLIFGNFLGAIVSVVMVFLFGSEPWVMALAVATAIKLMQLTKTLHPPGGAVALVGVMSKAEVSFIVTPVLVGSIILLFCTIGFNNLMPGRSYPKR
jgi:CBS-domain-containing membrane protein